MSMKKTIVLLLVLMMTFTITTSVFAETYPIYDPTPTATSTPNSQTFFLGMNDMDLIEDYSGVQIKAGSNSGNFIIGSTISFLTKNPVGIGISGGQAVINDCIAGRQAFIADVLKQMKSGEAKGLQVKITPNTTSNYPVAYTELNIVK